MHPAVLDRATPEILLTGKAAGRKVEDIVNAQGGCFGNALQAASLEGHVEIITLLLGSPGVGPAQKDNFGRTALFWASRNGHWRVVEELLSDERIDPDSEDWCGSTSLFVAVANVRRERPVLFLGSPNAPFKTKTEPSSD